MRRADSDIRVSSLGRVGGVPFELLADLVLPDQEAFLVELLASHPPGDLVVAFAGVARPAGGHDVVDRVAPASRDRENRVLLHGHAAGAAVRTAVPGLLQVGPLLVGEVVVALRHAVLAALGIAGSTGARRHRPRFAGPPAKAVNRRNRTPVSTPCAGVREAPRLNPGTPRSRSTHVSEIAHPRSVLIAGGSGGLGAAIASELAARGDVLTLVARNADRLGAVPVAAKRLALDLRDPRNADIAVEAAVDHGGGLDVVVNAIGVVAFGNVVDLSLDTMEELFLTNTFVPIALAKAALTHLRAGGVIVNISGVIAEQNLPGMAAYGASKAAVASFDEALAREARRAKVRVIDARPPHTETGLADRAIEGQAPRMPEGLPPETVAKVIAEAIDGDVTDLPSRAFG